jgi:hypothetical protein
LPRNGASKGLRRRAEFAIVDGRRSHTAYPRNGASDQEPTTTQVHLDRNGYSGNPLKRITLSLALFVLGEVFRRHLAFETRSLSVELILQ